MDREECITVRLVSDNTLCTIRVSTYDKYRNQFKKIRDELSYSDKELRAYLKEKGIVFKGRVTRDKLIRSLDELYKSSTGNKE